MVIFHIHIKKSGNTISPDTQILQNIINPKEPLELPPQSDDGRIFHFAVASDPHFGESEFSEYASLSILKEIHKKNYDAFFLLGDIAKFRGDDYGIYENSVKYLNEYTSDIPKFIIPGNHDALLGSLPKFKKIFMTGTDASLNNRIDAGSIHFLFINMLWGPEDFSKKDEQWLIEQLSSIPKDDYIFVFSHCYYFSDGNFLQKTKARWYDNPKMIKRFCPLFKKYNVNAVFSGHKHHLNLLEDSGIPYCIAGSMGGKLDSPVTYNSPASVWVNNQSFGYIDVAVYNNKFILNFLNEEGTLLNTRTYYTDIEE